jgi:hypothetical protein
MQTAVVVVAIVVVVVVVVGATAVAYQSLNLQKKLTITNTYEETFINLQEMNMLLSHQMDTLFV